MSSYHEIFIRTDNSTVVITLRSFTSDKAHEKKAATDIFEKMAAIGDYVMILAFDLQRLIAEHPARNE